MGLGVLESTKEAHVLGTALLDESADISLNEAMRNRLKTATGTNGIIVLVPQPSEDPDDPLVSTI